MLSSINLLHCICMAIFEPFLFSDSKKGYWQKLKRNIRSLSQNHILDLVPVECFRQDIHQRFVPQKRWWSPQNLCQSCCVVWHDNMQMHIWRLQALSSVPLDRDRKCNSGHLSLLPSLFHGLSDYIENLGWCNGKIDKGTDLNTQTILSSLSASPEDTSLLAL